MFDTPMKTGLTLLLRHLVDHENIAQRAHISSMHANSTSLPLPSVFQQASLHAALLKTRPFKHAAVFTSFFFQFSVNHTASICCSLIFFPPKRIIPTKDRSKHRENTNSIYPCCSCEPTLIPQDGENLIKGKSKGGQR